MSQRRKARLPCGRPLPTKASVNKSRMAKAFSSTLDAYVQLKKLNRSSSREKIADVILDLDDHFTSNELVLSVQKKYPKIGSATVYRSLLLFVDAGLIRESLRDDNRQAVYELEMDSHHDHIVCLDCDAILEFHEEKIETLQKKVLSKLKFREKRHRHVIYARCDYR